MCCKSLFNPDRIGTLVYSCGCGCQGQDPKWIIAPEREVMYTGKVKGQMTLLTDSANPHEATCPVCGAEEGGSMLLLQCRKVPEIVEVPSKFEEGATWEKTVWNWAVVAKLPTDSFITGFQQQQFSWRVFWEAVRYVGVEVPKKRDFVDKREWKRERRKLIANHKISIREMLINMLKDEHMTKGESIRVKLKALLTAIGVDLSKVEMGTKLPVLKMAQKTAIKRMEAGSAGMVDRLSARPIHEMISGLDEIIESLEEGYRRDVKEDVRNILINLAECGATHITLGVINSLHKNPFCLREVGFSGYVPREKTDKVARDFWENNPVLKQKFEEGEFSMERGKIGDLTIDGKVPEIALHGNVGSMWEWALMDDEVAQANRRSVYHHQREAA